MDVGVEGGTMADRRRSGGGGGGVVDAKVEEEKEKAAAVDGDADVDAEGEEPAISSPGVSVIARSLAIEDDSTRPWLLLLLFFSSPPPPTTPLRPATSMRTSAISQT